jgi:hypothetical protein
MIIDTCLYDQKFGLCISLLTCHMAWTFCLIIRNTFIINFKESKENLLNLWLCPFNNHTISQILLHLAKNIEVPSFWIFYTKLEIYSNMDTQTS